MKCPACGNPETRVNDSRNAREGAEIRRRRQCDSCHTRFTTYERAEHTTPAVIKKDGRREPWNRDKLLSGLFKACEKRPISIEDIEALADNVGEELSAKGEPEIPAERIGESIMRRLRDLDEVAYVRFASVYRSFKDIDEFMNELGDLIKTRSALHEKGS
jgi:transcriptional repressor NrdR